MGNADDTTILTIFESVWLYSQQIILPKKQQVFLQGLAYNIHISAKLRWK